MPLRFLLMQVDSYLLYSRDKLNLASQFASGCPANLIRTSSGQNSYKRRKCAYLNVFPELLRILHFCDFKEVLVVGYP